MDNYCPLLWLHSSIHAKKCMHVYVPMCSWVEGEHGCICMPRLQMQKSVMLFPFLYLKPYIKVVLSHAKKRALRNLI